MGVGGRPPIRVEIRRGFWRLLRAGASVESAARSAGVSPLSGARWLKQAGGVLPRASSLIEPDRSLTGGVSRWLSFAEREQIGLLRAAGCGVREIARRVGRDPSMISRELRRTPRNRKNYGRPEYWPSLAQADADQRARRPKPGRLSTRLRLRAEVQNRLLRGHSPEQIAARLRDDFPDDAEMWVSHETIYQSLYVQGRGGLRRELAAQLRTGRAVRHPRRAGGERRAGSAGW